MVNTESPAEQQGVADKLAQGILEVLDCPLPRIGRLAGRLADPHELAYLVAADILFAAGLEG